MTEILLLRISFDTEEVIRRASFTEMLFDTSSSKPFQTLNVQIHDHMLVQTIIYCVTQHFTTC